MPQLDHGHIYELSTEEILTTLKDKLYQYSLYNPVNRFFLLMGDSVYNNDLYDITLYDDILQSIRRHRTNQTQIHKPKGYSISIPQKYRRLETDERYSLDTQYIEQTIATIGQRYSQSSSVKFVYFDLADGRKTIEVPRDLYISYKEHKRKWHPREGMCLLSATDCYY